MAPIFTSYYGNLRRLTASGILPISISLSPPKWFDGLGIHWLAPTRALLYPQEGGLSAADYTEAYLKQISKKSPGDVARIVDSVAAGQPVALLCYERPDEFCHRHLVADYIAQAIGPVEEFPTAVKANGELFPELRNTG